MGLVAGLTIIQLKLIRELRFFLLMMASLRIFGNSNLKKLLIDF